MGSEMNFIDWIPAVSTSTLLVVLAYLSKSLIETRLKNSVESEFNEKLEALKSNLRSKEAEISALQNGALSGLVSRQEILYKRELEAIDNLWEVVIKLHKAKPIAQSMALFNFEACAKEAPKNPNFRQVFEMIDNGFDAEKSGLELSQKSRPYISSLAWAYFQAYQASIYYFVVQLKILKTGVDNPEQYISPDNAKALIKAALPHQSELLDEHGEKIFYYLVDELESTLLKELQSTLAGGITDKSNTEKAAKILKMASDLVAEGEQKEASIA